MRWAACQRLEVRAREEDLRRISRRCSCGLKEMLLCEVRAKEEDEMLLCEVRAKEEDHRKILRRAKEEDHRKVLRRRRRRITGGS